MGWFKSSVDQICPKCNCGCEVTSWNAGSLIDGLIMGTITYLVCGSTVKCPRCGAKYPRQEKSPTESKPATLSNLTEQRKTTPETTADADVTVTSVAQFDRTVSQGVVLVYFWAKWCAVCPVMSQIIADANAGRLTLVKVEVEQNSALVDRYKIKNVPTLMIFKGGNAVAVHVGTFPKDDLARWLNQHHN